MPRIRPLDEATAGPVVSELLGAVRKKLGSVPNLISTMANSPAVAKAYLGLSQTLSTGLLPARLREQLALVVGETNGCDYCVAAHTALGKGAGLSEKQTRDARLGTAENAEERAGIQFARKVVAARGMVDDRDLDEVRAAGYSDGEIGEIVAHVALNVFTNYFNLVAQTEVDFPAAAKVAA